METTKDRIQEVLDKHNITVSAEFVPWSKSRNVTTESHKITDKSLNWKVTVKCGDSAILTTDYMAGIAHCPSYKKIRNPFSLSMEDAELLNFECEKGKIAGGYYSSLSSVMPSTNPKKRGDILPDAKDVIYSLLMDSEAIDYTFEEWAADFGYDTDSRKAEKMYNDCLQIGLKMRRLGESVLAELKEIYQDY